MTDKTRWQIQSDQYRELLKEVAELHDRKGKDYGHEYDQYANIRASEEFNIPAWLGAVVRANDKIARIKSFCKKGRLENESLRESILDAAVYFLNALMLLDEEEKEGKDRGLRKKKRVFIGRGS